MCPGDTCQSPRSLSRTPVPRPLEASAPSGLHRAGLLPGLQHSDLLPCRSLPTTLPSYGQKAAKPPLTKMLVSEEKLLLSHSSALSAIDLSGDVIHIAQRSSYSPLVIGHQNFLVLGQAQNNFCKNEGFVGVPLSKGVL